MTTPTPPKLEQQQQPGPRVIHPRFTDWDEDTVQIEPPPKTKKKEASA